MAISDLRREYEAHGLRKADLDPDPMVLFQRWFDQAIQADILDANAMTLATVSAKGAPSARIILIKGIQSGGVTFFTNYNSDKGRDLEANPNAALMFYWPPLHQQVRIAGQVEKVSRRESEEYFASRPRGSQISAAVSPQSQPLASRDDLDHLADELEEKLKGQPVPCPPNWGGYRLVPDRVEFWQGRPNRLHDRFRYTRQPAGGWIIDRLAP